MDSNAGQQISITLNQDQMNFIKEKGGSKYIQDLIDEQMKKGHHRPESVQTSNLISKLRKLSSTE